MITPEALTRIEEYCNKATPGPWAVYGNKERQLGQQSGALVAAVAPGQQIHSYHGGGVSPLFDQEFIANARQDIPLLISSLREAQERIGKLEEALGFYADEHNWLRMDNSNSRASLNRGLIARAALESK